MVHTALRARKCSEFVCKQASEIRARSTENRRKKKKNAKSGFSFTSRSAYVNLCYIAILYTHSIANQPHARYSNVCNVLRLWRMSLISTYRVYRRFDSKSIRLVFHVALSLSLAFEKLIIWVIEKASSRMQHRGRGLLRKA